MENYISEKQRVYEEIVGDENQETVVRIETSYQEKQVWHERREVKIQKKEKRKRIVVFLSMK